MPLCKSTNVEPRTQILTTDGHAHAGSLTHRCIQEEKGHAEQEQQGEQGTVVVPLCECTCGKRWVRNY